VQRWLARHPRFQAHFTPTGSSWLKLVERFFRDLPQERLRRGVFRDVEELIKRYWVQPASLTHGPAKNQRRSNLPSGLRRLQPAIPKRGAAVR